MRIRCVLASAAVLAALGWNLSGQGLPVSYERLLKAADEPGNWLMHSHTYNSWRFSSLNQITTANVKNLHMKWLFQGRHIEKFETTPLVVNGVMYLTRRKMPFMLWTRPLAARCGCTSTGIHRAPSIAAAK